MAAIRHASGVFQAVLGRTLVCRHVPHLRFEADRKFHTALETLRLIEQIRRQWDESASKELSDSDQEMPPEEFGI